jgi:hypothetical protein
VRLPVLPSRRLTVIAVATLMLATTGGAVTAQQSGGWPAGNYLYQRTVVARGGEVMQDLIQP